MVNCSKFTEYFYFCDKNIKYEIDYTSNFYSTGMANLFIEWVTNGILLWKKGKVGFRFNNFVLDIPKIRSLPFTAAGFQKQKYKDFHSENFKKLIP